MKVIGIDPSFRGCGVSDGLRHFVINTEKVAETPSQGEDLYRRSRQIVGELMTFVSTHYPGGEIAFYIEAPAYGQTRDASHLVEVGWLLREFWGLREAFPSRIKVVEVSNSTVRKHLLGKGNISGAQLPLAVYKKFGLEFEKDAKLDKLNAFLLQKFGEGVEIGEIPFAPMAKRGDKKKRAAA